jgi:hypothetical protein
MLHAPDSAWTRSMHEMNSEKVRGSHSSNVPVERAQANTQNPCEWWDRENDQTGRPLRADVRTAGHEIWRVACNLTRTVTGDCADAPALMESSVEQISRYLDRKGVPLFAVNAVPLLMAALNRTVRRYGKKLQRLRFIGGSNEFADQVIAPDWVSKTELRLDVDKITRGLSEQSSAIFHLKCAGYEWKQIASCLQLTEARARKRFWREIKRQRTRAQKCVQPNGKSY